MHVNTVPENGWIYITLVKWMDGNGVQIKWASVYGYTASLRHIGNRPIPLFWMTLSLFQAQSGDPLERTGYPVAEASAGATANPNLKMNKRYWLFIEWFTSLHNRFWNIKCSNSCDLTALLDCILSRCMRNNVKTMFKVRCVAIVPWYELQYIWYSVCLQGVCC